MMGQGSGIKRKYRFLEAADSAVPTALVRVGRLRLVSCQVTTPHPLPQNLNARHGVTVTENSRNVKFSTKHLQSIAETG
jgi:hypothetical protein